MIDAIGCEMKSLHIFNILGPIPSFPIDLLLSNLSIIFFTSSGDMNLTSTWRFDDFLSR